AGEGEGAGEGAGEGEGDGGQKIELLHDYGQPEREQVDFSNPFALLASLGKQKEASGKPRVALIYVDGVIQDGDGGAGLFDGDGAAGSDDLRKALREAARDEEVRAIVLRIDSPGGSALASEVIWQAARRAAERKPLVISIGSMAASGGYYIASAGDHIFADPAGIVGSIGVVGGKFVWKDLYAKLGLSTETFSRGRNADLFSSSHPWTDRQRKLVTGWMKQTYDQFTQRILSTRGGKIKHIDDVARGRIFSARQAKDLGLIDEIGGLQQALAHAADQADLADGQYEVKTLPEPRTLADYFGGGAGGGGGADPDAAWRLRPSLGADALLPLLDGPSRRLVGQQLRALRLLQKHPVMLVAPFALSVR
ncbi:MAG TPA: signal peptide peptidase SppA, partial [Tepidisphaeraceae bacterium]|nr:signal peptide peptidase SppA [Tepidisphaeraceae bacterium]